MNDADRRRSRDGFDDDAIFADIVAHLNDDPSEPEPTGPVAPDAPADHETTLGAADETTGEKTDPPTDEGDAPAVPATQVWRAHEADDEPEEHFEPPPVTPLPAGDLQFWAIIAGMTAGPLLLVYLVFFNRDASSYWVLAAIAMGVGGFALLVSRLPGHDGDDDDGARL